VALTYHHRELVVLGYMWIGASSSGIPLQGADSINQPGEAEKITGGRDSLVVRNLPALSIEVTSLGASSSDISPQGAGGSSKPVDWHTTTGSWWCQLT
jgi:hypothetical protein